MGAGGRAAGAFAMVCDTALRCGVCLARPFPARRLVAHCRLGAAHRRHRRVADAFVGDRRSLPHRRDRATHRPRGAHRTGTGSQQQHGRQLCRAGTEWRRRVQVAHGEAFPYRVRAPPRRGSDWRGCFQHPADLRPAPERSPRCHRGRPRGTGHAGAVVHQCRQGTLARAVPVREPPDHGFARDRAGLRRRHGDRSSHSGAVARTRSISRRFTILVVSAHPR